MGNTWADRCLGMDSRSVSLNKSTVMNLDWLCALQNRGRAEIIATLVQQETVRCQQPQTLVNAASQCSPRSTPTGPCAEIEVVKKIAEDVSSESDEYEMC